MTELTIAATCMGVRVPHSPFLNETRIQRIEQARYEGDEIAGALAVVREGDRVLEMGAGLGIVGAVIAHHAKPSAVLSFEANPDLVPHIQALHASNGLDGVIALRNQVLLSGPDRPETVTFYLRNSFLGSSLIDQDARQTRPVEVETADFDAVVASFRPDVLVIDIEGGELELLQHTNLDGIRAVVIEFHPGIYGKAGVKACKDLLRLRGFEKRGAESTRFVWTCERPDWRADRNNSPPHPEHGTSQTLRIVERAVVQSPTSAEISAPSGVMDAKGRDVPEAALWRRMRRVNLAFPRPAAVTETIPGTWLWGGTLWRNFAHFIAESPARLWGLDATREKLDGILFIPRRSRTDYELAGYQRGLFDALGIDLPIRVVPHDAEVERLIVPGQGFGIGQISAGTEAFRRFMADRMGRDIAPEGSESLYVSRSALGPNRGALLGEVRIERELAAQGYEIFHPEQHDIATQIARYKAARRIVAAEGSALHLFAYVGRADQKVAVIPRRRSSATRHILTHLRSFTGAEPLLADALQAVWQPQGIKRARLSVGEPDLARLQALLAEGGFVAPGPTWEPLPEEDVRAALGDSYIRRGEGLAA